MMKRSVLIPLFLLCSICVLSGCKEKKHEEIDLSSIHTTAAEALKETLAPAPPVKETTAATEAEKSSASDTGSSSAASVSARIEQYKTDQISIEYPVVANLYDADTQSAVNDLLKKNAQSILTGYEIDPEKDILTIKCDVKSIDRRRITAVYTGSYVPSVAAHPVSLFYTNTVDLEQGKDLSLNDFSDAYTMAGYVMSDDCEFYNVSAELKKELLDYRATQSLESYTELFHNADFPIETSDQAAFPESFSYTNQGVLYFSIPVPHALGDVAIVKFNLDGK